MTLFSIPAFVVYDLEFTAWDGVMARKWMAPGEFKEVIQIGAVKVGGDFTPLETLNLLVRPTINPHLSAYIEKLTGLTNAAVAARGLSFAAALEKFTAFAGALPVVSFGRDDLVLADNIRLLGLRAALPPRCIDIRFWLMENGIDVRGLHACDVGPAAGVPFEGQTHDGLADALSVATGVHALMARGAAAPTAPEKEIFP
jgi:inhibitor of KinA sporulation pathway (predicted exonuclease)